MFYDIYCNLCKQKGLSPSRAALDMGINKGTVSIWKKGTYMPRQDTLQKIAKYFNVPVDYLLGNNTSEETPVLTKKDERDISKRQRQILSEQEQELLNNWDAMNDAGHNELLKQSRLLLKDPQYLACGQSGLGETA